ncbi:MAG: hemin uptake protein HemP [Pseudomonadota bacterium]|jgi:hemin uptake protein HemP
MTTDARAQPRSPFADASAPAADAGAGTEPVFDSRELLQGGREVVIRHGGECYRLRHTRNDKLILTK